MIASPRLLVLVLSAFFFFLVGGVIVSTALAQNANVDACNAARDAAKAAEQNGRVVSSTGNVVTLHWTGSGAGESAREFLQCDVTVYNITACTSPLTKEINPALGKCQSAAEGFQLRVAPGSSYYVSLRAGSALSLSLVGNDGFFIAAASENPRQELPPATSPPKPKYREL